MHFFSHTDVSSSRPRIMFPFSACHRLRVLTRDANLVHKLQRSYK